MKYQFIKSNRSTFTVVKMCQVLEVTKSGYYGWIKNPESQRKRENKQLLKEIKKIFKKSRRTYGSPRITPALHDKGIRVSRNRVARIMRKNGIVAKMKRRFKVTTQSNHKYPYSPNLLNQNFFAAAANLIWLSDITYIRTLEGWLYLTVIIDLYNRKVIGWSMSDRLTTETTTVPALIHAYRSCQPLPGTIFHSDRGVQYADDDFRELLDSFNMIQSMSGTGNCYDNAVAESFFHTLKTELVYHERYRTRLEAKRSIFEYMEVFYNRFRKHSALGYKSPEEFGQLTYKQVI